MKTLTLSLSALVLAAAAAGAYADDAKPLALATQGTDGGRQAEERRRRQGRSRIAKAAGKNGTLVVFTCNELPLRQGLGAADRRAGQHLLARRASGVLLINSNNPTVSKKDSFELTQARAKERGMQFAYAVDPDSSVAKAFGATRTPEAFLFDKGGKLVYHGTIDDNHEEADKVEKRYLKDALEAVSAGKTPAVQETKSLGCTIKFAKVS